MSLKSVVKNALFRVAACVGDVFPSRGLPILTYHSVDETGSPISKSVEKFRQEMQFLKDAGYQSLTLSEAIKHLKTGENASRKMCVITFDDGFANNFEQAFPILEEVGFTATIFLVTSLIGQQSQWNVSEAIQQAGADALPLMNWDQIREMANAGFEFGSHTKSHPYLTTLPDSQLREELLESRKNIEDELGVGCSTLCYPYGDANGQVREAAREAGYDAAVTIRFGLNQQNGNDLFNLKRLGSARFSTETILRASLNGGYGWHLRQRTSE